MRVFIPGSVKSPWSLVNCLLSSKILEIISWRHWAKHIDCYFQKCLDHLIIIKSCDMTSLNFDKWVIACIYLENAHIYMDTECICHVYAGKGTIFEIFKGNIIMLIIQFSSNHQEYAYLWCCLLPICVSMATWNDTPCFIKNIIKWN